MKIKKWLSLTLAGLTCFATCGCSILQGGSSASSGEEGVKAEELVDFVVNVEAGRDVRVLQLTDTQFIDYSQLREGDEVSSMYAPEKKEAFCYRYIRQVVNRYQPDLILVTGDIVYGKFDDNGSALTEYIAFMEEFKIPWAPIFGNHDGESRMGADWQCQQFENAEYCLFKQRELTGNGNYTVGIQQGDRLQRVFFMLDSNGVASMSEETAANGHSRREVGFGADQIKWYKEEAKKIKEESPKTKLSFVFHIQLTAFQNAIREYVDYENFSSLDLDKEESAQSKGDFGYIGHTTKNDWDADFQVWNGLKELGVDSIFVGHEHCNSFSIVYDGIRLQYGQKSSQYDRYNKIINGNVVGSYDHEGTPILGGTKITLNKNNGAIYGDSGLILWDPALEE